MSAELNTKFESQYELAPQVFSAEKKWEVARSLECETVYTPFGITLW